MAGPVLASDLPEPLRSLMKKLKDNLLICCVKRAGGRLEFPVAEVDAANDLLEIISDTDRRVFVLTTTSRQ